MLPFINVPFDYVASNLGASRDELKLIFSFLISYPLSGVLKRIPDSQPWQKNVFIIGVSLFYLIGLFDLYSGLFTLSLTAFGSYAIAKYVKSPLMPWIGFVFAMGYMSISHIYRQIANTPGNVDVTGAQMVLVMKMTAFCWNVYDGRLPDNEMSDLQREKALRKLPEILDFAGYVFFFPSLMAGPAFDYVDYSRYITTSMFELPKGADPAKAPPTRKKRKVPRSGTPAAIKAVTGLIFIFAFLTFSTYYYPQYMLGDDFMKYSLIRRIWIMHVINFTVRMKYYGVWYLTEGACILSGIGYNGMDPKTGRARWDRVQNVRPFGIEFAQNPHAYLGEWNINTNLWLKNYIYVRVTPKGKKPGFRATLSVSITSAFWHGFYPGYYLAFLFASFVQTVSKNARRLLRPFFLTPDGKKELPTKRFYDLFSYLCTQAAFTFAVSPFVMLGFSDSINVWARVYFYAIIGVAASFAFIYSPGKKALTKELAKRKKAAGVGAETDMRDTLRRTVSTDWVNKERERRIMLGIPDDPQQEVEDIINEVKAEIESRNQKGQSIPADIRKLVEEKVGTKLT